jgi:hypothetical protein
MLRYWIGSSRSSEHSARTATEQPLLAAGSTAVPNQTGPSQVSDPTLGSSDGLMNVLFLRIRTLVAPRQSLGQKLLLVLLVRTSSAIDTVRQRVSARTQNGTLRWRTRHGASRESPSQERQAGHDAASRAASTSPLSAQQVLSAQQGCSQLSGLPHRPHHHTQASQIKKTQLLNQLLLLTTLRQHNYSANGFVYDQRSPVLGHSSRERQSVKTRSTAAKTEPITGSRGTGGGGAGTAAGSNADRPCGVACHCGVQGPLSERRFATQNEGQGRGRGSWACL